jgi:hypothetical protein
MLRSGMWMEQLFTKLGFFLSWLGFSFHVFPPPMDLFNITIVFIINLTSHDLNCLQN